MFKGTGITGAILLSMLGSASGADAGVGASAPGFSLPSSDNQTVSLQKLVAENKAVAVIFMATRCPYSNAFNDVMSELSRTYAQRGVTFVGINPNKTEPRAEVREHAEKNRFSFRVLKDDGHVVADKYGAVVTPEVFLVDAEGRIRYHGAIGNSKQPTTKATEANGRELMAAIEDALAGRAVETAETKMFGCSIKR